jgi:hypothetical protein
VVRTKLYIYVFLFQIIWIKLTRKLHIFLKQYKLISISHYFNEAVWILTNIKVSLEEQDLLIIPEHLSSPLILSGVRVT